MQKYCQRFQADTTEGRPIILYVIVRANTMCNWNPFYTKGYRAVHGIASDVQKLSWIELGMKSPRATGLFLFCTSKELPQSVEFLLGNDICRDSCAITRIMCNQEAETINPVKETIK